MGKWIFRIQTNPRTLMFVEVKWVSDCCLRPSKQFISYVCMVRTSYIRWEDDFYFVLDQPAASLDFYGASSLKQPSTSRTHVDMLLNSWSQPVCALTPWCCMLEVEKQQISTALKPIVLLVCLLKLRVSAVPYYWSCHNNSPRAFLFLLWIS